MKIIIALTALVLPAAGSAQTVTGSNPTMNGPNYSTYNTAVESYGQGRVADTPTMQRQKLTRALALREEANQLRIADGGTLSAASLRYIQRKSDAITGRYQRLGSLTR